MRPHLAELAFRILQCALLAGLVTLARADSAPSTPLSNDVKWFRESAERQVAYEQAYRQAWESIKAQLAQGVVGGWAVVMDADETIIDNSEFQERQAPGAKFDSGKWDAWLTEQARRASGDKHEDFVFPQARDFIAQVHAAGGRIAIVTNRLQSQCPRTESVLKSSAAQPLHYDVLLCAADSKSGKEERFSKIQMGEIPEIGRVNVLLFVGDNILDCQGQSQHHYVASAFGSRCIVLPNPMYGSWQ